MALHRWRSALSTRVAVIAALAAVICAAMALSATGSSRADGGVTTNTGTLPDGATYLIQVPNPWNGTLLLYSHGYVVPGSSNPARDVGDPLTGQYLLDHGYALAGSSYATTGWAIQQAIPDQIATLDTFDSLVGTPTRTIAWGHSLGGMITAGLMQDDPSRFAGALPMCGVLAGGVATWNQGLDAEFAIRQLLAPPGSTLQLVHITNPFANLGTAEAVMGAAQQTPQGRARLALAGALGDLPGWFTTGSPEPAPTDYAAQELNQFEWETQVDGPFLFAFRAELEARAGGNPSWNTGVNYWEQLANSIDFREVRALYAQAGLSLAADIRTLNSAPRISADPNAVSYVTDNIVYNGNLDDKPVLTMHTTGDGLVANQNEQAYASVVRDARDERFLRQTFVHRAGHCAFTPAETITALQALVQRIDTGRWRGIDPTDFNASAATLGTTLNTAPPAFIPYEPTPYLRPFDLGRH
jgi:pimeloyl-ACP methyl ester carboxylesterase